MPGYDMNPVYSADGNYIAFHSDGGAGFESDRNRIFTYDRKAETFFEVTQGTDQTTHDATWSNDGSTLFFDSETRGTHQVYAMGSDGKAKNSFLRMVQLLDRGFLQQRRREEHSAFAQQQSMLRPTELAILDTETKQLVTITDVNDDIYQELELPTIEERFFTASDGKKIQNWVILPPDYDARLRKEVAHADVLLGRPSGTDRSVVFLSLELSHDGFQGLRGLQSTAADFLVLAENGMTKSG